MKGYLREGYENYKKIEYYRTEKRLEESRNKALNIFRTVF